MSRLLKIIPAGLLLPALVGAPAAAAQTVDVRAYYESVDHRGEAMIDWMSLRTRLGVDTDLDPSVGVVVEMQDSRLIGGASEQSLHQGLIRWSPSDQATLRVGRQEMILGNERFFGAHDASRHGRALDGARLTVRVPSVLFDAFAFQLADRHVGADATETVAGVWGHVTPDRGPAVDLFTYMTRFGAGDVESTSGLQVRGRYRALEYRAEWAFQTGRAGDAERAGRMVAVGLDITPGGLWSVGLGHERIGGEQPDSPRQEAFTTRYGSPRAFHGDMDLFGHMGAHGLNDSSVRFTLRAADAVSVRLGAHAFAAADGADGPAALAREVHGRLNIDLAPSLRFEGGVGYVQAGARWAPYMTDFVGVHLTLRARP